MLELKFFFFLNIEGKNMFELSCFVLLVFDVDVEVCLVEIIVVGLKIVLWEKIGLIVFDLVVVFFDLGREVILLRLISFLFKVFKDCIMWLILSWFLSLLILNLKWLFWGNLFEVLVILLWIMVGLIVKELLVWFFCKEIFFVVEVMVWILFYVGMLII